MVGTAFISHSDCYLHEMGAFHPECPSRLSAITQYLTARGLDSELVFYDAPLATHEQLLRVHSESYLERLQHISPEQGIVHLDPDTAMNPHTWRAALRSAGAGVKAVDLVMSGEVQNAFCAIRPPGHHAERSKALGFCFFNNVAVAAMHALEAHGLSRVAIVDFDVHHGNGTEACFRDFKPVLMVGIFQHPFYPYSGTDHPASNMFNVPLSSGASGDDFRQVVHDVWLPRLRKFKPQMILISAGFDAHREDDLGGLQLLDADFVWVTEQLLQIASETANGRIVSMLEGGYVLPSLARSVEAHLSALAGI